MRNWLKRLGNNIVATIAVVVVGVVLSGIVAILGWIFSLIPKTTKGLDPFSVVITIVFCLIISLFGEVVGRIWKKIRRNRKLKKVRDEEDEDEDE